MILKLLLLVSLLVVVIRQSYAVADYCDGDDDCKLVCIPPYACNLTRHLCMCNPNPSHDHASSSEEHCIPGHKDCGGIH
ncbi:hypothetical protein CARUB_v10015727mg [Capsella rubella]|uniref:Uncharacterized protein n=2 Tax=Capsella rubella TaxID=81985 RepID=R0GA61_9BRAS|nr:hypothetical protein CARUB_v10015727mg [Capsella rubella]